LCLDQLADAKKSKAEVSRALFALQDRRQATHVAGRPGEFAGSTGQAFDAAARPDLPDILGVTGFTLRPVNTAIGGGAEVALWFFIRIQGLANR
jgi:hypothetical protein